MNQTSDTADRELVITRLLQAPPSLVFEVWTSPQHVVNWWGPNGFTTTLERMEVHPGGVWQFVMHGPDGTNFDNKYIFHEVSKPTRLRYSSVEDGEFDVEVTFEEQDGKTNLTLRIVFKTAEERDRIVRESGAIEGGNQTLNRLEAYLASR